MSDTTEETSTIAAGQLRSFIQRIEIMEAEKKTLGDDIKEIYAELKGNGFDAKAVREIIRLRKQADHERQEHEAMLDLYRQALGMGGSIKGQAKQKFIAYFAKNYPKNTMIYRTEWHAEKIFDDVILLLEQERQAQ